MKNSQQTILADIENAIDKLVLVTPQELIDRINGLLLEIKGNSEINLKQVQGFLIEIGREEYAYRKAYHDLCGTDEEQRLRELVLARVDEVVKVKLEEAFSYNLILDDFLKSPLFEEMDDEHRAQVKNAILMAEDTLEHQCDERAHKQRLKFEELVEVRKKEVAEMQGQIDYLKDLARTHANHADELLATIERLEDGWSILTKDVKKDEIEKEVEYWQAILANSDGVGEFDLDEHLESGGEFGDLGEFNEGE